MSDNKKSKIDNIYNDYDHEEIKEVDKKPRGRPKGSGGNKRPDRKEIMSVYSNPGDNSRYLKHTLRMWDWKKPDMTNLDDVNARIKDYMQICIDDDIKPSMEGMALAFDVDRKTLWCWANNVDSKYLPDEVRTSIKKVYQLLNAQFVNYAQDGKMDRSVAIFLMKNNYGYRDETEVVLKPDNPLGDKESMEDLNKKYIENVYGDSATIIDAEASSDN